MSRALSALSIYRVLFSLAYNQERVAQRLNYNVKTGLQSGTGRSYND